jgi:hypothetical protein
MQLEHPLGTGNCCTVHSQRRRRGRGMLGRALHGEAFFRGEAEVLDDVGADQAAPARSRFAAMRDAFLPVAVDSRTVKQRVGGALLSVLDHPAYSNMCVVRVSRAVNYGLTPIPSLSWLYTVMGGDGMRYAIRVSEFERWLTERFGRPGVTVVRNNQEGTEAFAQRARRAVSSAAPNTGIIQFDVQFTDATGHFDLWARDRCLYQCYFNNPRLRRVNLWRFS